MTALQQQIVQEEFFAGVTGQEYVREIAVPFIGFGGGDRGGLARRGEGFDKSFASRRMTSAPCFALS